MNVSEIHSSSEPLTRLKKEIEDFEDQEHFGDRQPVIVEMEEQQREIGDKRYHNRKP